MDCFAHHCNEEYHQVDNLRWFSLIPSRSKKRMAIMAKNIEMYVIAVLEYFIIVYDTSVRRSNTDNRSLNSSFLSRICDNE